MTDLLFLGLTPKPIWRLPQKSFWSATCIVILITLQIASKSWNSCCIGFLPLHQTTKYRNEENYERSERGLGKGMDNMEKKMKNVENTTILMGKAQLFWMQYPHM